MYSETKDAMINAARKREEWNLANPKSLGPEGVQISEMLGLVKCMIMID